MGIETRPNETVPEPMERAAMGERVSRPLESLQLRLKAGWAG
jgi:hypothetical protein